MSKSASSRGCCAAQATAGAKGSLLRSTCSTESSMLHASHTGGPAAHAARCYHKVTAFVHSGSLSCGSAASQPADGPAIQVPWLGCNTTAPRKEMTARPQGAACPRHHDPFTSSSIGTAALGRQRAMNMSTSRAEWICKSRGLLGRAAHLRRMRCGKRPAHVTGKTSSRQGARLPPVPGWPPASCTFRTPRPH